MRAAVAICAAAMLAACGDKGGTEAGQTPTAEAPTSAPAGVTREEVAQPTPTPTPTPAAAIQEQPGPGGATVKLTRVAVTGDVLTVQLLYVGGRVSYDYFPVQRVSAIDDATSRQLGVLKDGAGNWLAAPLDNDGKQIRAESGSPAGTVVWFKFPAPAATSPTVSINIPNVGPFDGVPVAR